MLKEYWYSLSETARSVTTNTLIGLGVLLLIHLSQNSSWVNARQDAGLDFVMSITANTSSRATVPYAFLDIDTETFLGWDEPLYTPRDKLTQLVEFAMSAQPKSLVIDIDVSRVTREGDEQLLELLASRQTDFPIILLKTFREESLTAPGFYRQQRPSAFDEVVANSGHLHWASPLFNRDSDFVVRQWRMWEPTCAEGSPLNLPSVQLLLYVIERGVPMSELDQRLNSSLPVDCEAWKDTALLQNRLEIGELRFNKEKYLDQRIIYHLPWHRLAKNPYPRIETETGQKTALLKVVSARNITESEVAPSSDLLRGHHVIIGASHSDGGDVHATPLGYMPGSLIILNSVHSLTTQGIVERQPLWITLLIEAVLLIAISYLFTRMKPGYASMLITLAIVVAIIPITFFVFKDGIWLDFSLPLLIVSLHKTFGYAGKMYDDAKELVRGVAR